MPTDRLGLPYVSAAQAQKEVTHNEALDMVDQYLGLRFIDLIAGFTPTGAGPDGYEWEVPRFEDEVVSYEVYEVIFRVGIAGSADATIQIQKSSGGDVAFGAGTNILTANLTVPAGSFRVLTTDMVGAAKTVQSGNLLRVNVIALGDPSNWHVRVYLKQVP